MTEAEAPKTACVVFVSLARHIEILQKETDRERRAKRKALGFHAMYSGTPDTLVPLPLHLVEQQDIDAALAGRGKMKHEDH